jgi:transposase-like protein
MRKRYDKAFKAKVALEALRGEKTVQEIATTYQVGAGLVALWKKELVEGASSIFE